MIVKATILKGKYLDSVKLMLISKKLRCQQGVLDAVVILATKENREILRSTGMLVPEIEPAAETDIVAVVKANDEQTAISALKLGEETINNPIKHEQQGGFTNRARNLEKADMLLNKADLCLISLAGRYAAAEADKALDLGIHVMLFSDNVSLESELALKQKAVEKGLLMMGPDCGTAIINGIPLAFANSVPRGKIGVVSASGTGLQEITCGISNMGGGISQAFGTGGRDGKKEIGGLMLVSCLNYLISDPATEVIVLMGKTPAPEVLPKLWQLVSITPKPVIVNFLKPMEVPKIANLTYNDSLTETARMACIAAGYPLTTEIHKVKPETERLSKPYLCGLYSGGTLCAEGIQIYKRFFGHEPFSNVGSDPLYALVDGWNTKQDSMIDLGDDEFTVGRPHPMIDFSLRIKKLEQLAADKEVGIILLDVVLGYGAHPDPAGELAPAIRNMTKDIKFVCHVLGTDGDPQNRKSQIEQLQNAGASVFTSHSQACEFACQCLHATREKA